MSRKLAHRPRITSKVELKRKVGYEDEDDVVARARRAVALLNLGEGDKHMET
jgi:uncharacterized protein YqfA (UPF0365 family)